MTTVNKLLHRLVFAPPGSGACLDLPVCHLWSKLSGALLWSETGHWVCCFWGTLGRTPSASQCQTLRVTGPVYTCVEAGSECGAG